MVLSVFDPALKNESDRDKFEYIYDEYRGLMLNKANKILKDKALAEDALYNSFLYIRKNIKTVGDPSGSRAAAFVVTVAKHCAFSLARRPPGAPNPVKKNRDFSVRGIENSLYDMSASQINRVVNRLGGINKNIFLLKYAYGFSIRKIALMLDESESNVGDRLQNAQRRLCVLLSRGGR